MSVLERDIAAMTIRIERRIAKLEERVTELAARNDRLAVLHDLVTADCAWSGVSR